MAIHTKYHLLRTQHPFNQPVDFSFGIYYKQYQEYYLVVARNFSNIDSAVLQAGVNYNNSTTNKKEWELNQFLCVGYPTKYSCFLLDWNSSTNESNFGWRVLLSPDIKVDLFIVNIGNIKTLFDNFVFGVTLVT